MKNTLNVFAKNINKGTGFFLNKENFSMNKYASIKMGTNSMELNFSPYATNKYHYNDKQVTVHRKMQDRFFFKENKDIESLQKSFNNASDIINGTYKNNDFFYTLTQTKRNKDSIYITNSKNDINNFTTKCNKTLKNKFANTMNLNIKSLISLIDLHRDGCIHIHGILNLEKDTNTLEKKSLYNLNKELKKFGLNIKIKRIYNIAALSNYLTKKTHNLKKYTNWKKFIHKIKTAIRIYKTSGEIKRRKKYIASSLTIKDIIAKLQNEINIFETYYKNFHYNNDTDNNITKIIFEYTGNHLNYINNILLNNKQVISLN